MNIAQAYGSGRFGLSFELFPPKTASGMRNLSAHVDRLVDCSPDYITCTFGAGGSTQDRTLEVIADVLGRHTLPVATHLTCVGLTADDIEQYLQRAVALGVENVVALRGDPPHGETEFRSIAGGFSYANELVAFIRGTFPRMGIAVGGYPETHQEAPNSDQDIANLKRKVDAGADVVITQLFYRNDDYFRFRDRCEAAGVDVPIVPGLLPVTNLAQITRIASLCGATLPADFAGALRAEEASADRQFEIGVEFALRQTDELVRQGAPGIHFYVLNKADATGKILSAVNLPGR